MGRRAEDADEKAADKLLGQLNSLTSNWKGLLIIVALAGGSGAGFDWLEPLSGGRDSVIDVSMIEMEVDTLQSQVAVLTSEQNGERQLRESGVNGNTLQINNLRNRISAIEYRLLND